MTYQVEMGDRNFYVRGLKDWTEKDTALFYMNPDSEWPEPSDPKDHDTMLGALYDLFQCAEDLKEGDIFETPFGKFICKDVHVLPL